MGLLDVVTGMMNGPRGHRDPSTEKGMSPLTMAILGLLAYNALKHFGGSQQPEPHGGSPGLAPSSDSGGLGGLLHGGLGGLLQNATAGGALSGGLKQLIDQLHQQGKGEIADSWIGKGPNRAISAQDIAAALGPDRINELVAATGMTKDDLLADLARHLPEAVDQATPDGRLPSDGEVRRWL